MGPGNQGENMKDNLQIATKFGQTDTYTENEIKTANKKRTIRSLKKRISTPNKEINAMYSNARGIKTIIRTRRCTLDRSANCWRPSRKIWNHIETPNNSHPILYGRFNLNTKSKKTTSRNSKLNKHFLKMVSKT